MALQIVQAARGIAGDVHAHIAIDASDNVILNSARARATRSRLGFAGSIAPVDAWQLFSTHVAAIVDVRTFEERRFVGHVPETHHVVWANGAGMVRNPRFLRELEAKVPKEAVVLFLCRSGKRSASAAADATKAGWTHAFNIAEGFEGELNNSQRRGTVGGWRHRGLPWLQQ